MTMSKKSKKMLVPALAGLVALAVVASLQPPAYAASSGGAETQAAEGPSREIIDRYCVTCHNERLQTAGLMLDQLDLSDIAGNAEMLEKMVHKLRNGQMPPEGRPRPDVATLTGFLASLQTALDRVAVDNPNPGRVASRRLNRLEYANAINDLLALEIDSETLLPSDMAGFGFDNNAEVLSITPSLMTRYIAAATKISRAAVGSPDNRPMMHVYDVGYERRDIRRDDNMPFATHGGVAVRHHFPLDGEYVFAIRLKRNETIETIDGIDEDEHQMEIRIDHELIREFDIGGRYRGPDPGMLIAVPEDDPEGQILHEYRMRADTELEIRVPVKAGTRLVATGFIDSAPSPSMPDELPGVDMLYISGPFDGSVPGETPSRERIFTCRPASPTTGAEDACAREIFSTLARRAYRRPVTDADIDALLGVYREGRADRDFEAGVERGLETLLSMPSFLMRVEQQPVDTRPGAIYELSDLELASRLSFFLWKSIPDDELLDLADEGRLGEPEVLTQQVQRLLADRRSTRFILDFAGQWLQMRNIDSQDPDGALFAFFNDSLRSAMVQETQLFIEDQVRNDRAIPELLTATYSYLNDQLAEHYGVAGVYGSRFRRHEWNDDRRHGLLGHASLLTVTSYANRTSVVLRGKWVLETLLGSPPPPPPPNVPPLAESDRANPTSLRERMEQHRQNPVCASCHRRMDPLGFAMEHFDATGRWRETDGGAPINAEIELSGQTINSPRTLREALLAEGDREFVRTVAEKMLIYALGRGVLHTDQPLLRQIADRLEQSGEQWSTLVGTVVASDQFRMRRAPMPEGDELVAAADQQ